jgi:hypothetical protein
VCSSRMSKNLEIGLRMTLFLRSYYFPKLFANFEKITSKGSDWRILKIIVTSHFSFDWSGILLVTKKINLPSWYGKNSNFFPKTQKCSFTVTRPTKIYHFSQNKIVWRWYIILINITRSKLNGISIKIPISNTAWYYKIFWRAISSCAHLFWIRTAKLNMNV